MHAQMRRLLRQGKDKSLVARTAVGERRSTRWTWPPPACCFPSASFAICARWASTSRRRRAKASCTCGVIAGHLLGIVPDLLCATEAEGRRLEQLLFDVYDGPDQDSTRLIQALMKNALPGLLAAALPHFLGQRANPTPSRGVSVGFVTGCRTASWGARSPSLWGIRPRSGATRPRRCCAPSWPRWRCAGGSSPAARDGRPGSATSTSGT